MWSSGHSEQATWSWSERCVGQLTKSEQRPDSDAMSCTSCRNRGQSMMRRICGIFTLVTLAASLARATNPPSPPADLSATQIVDKNVAARGGLQAWQAVQTL